MKQALGLAVTAGVATLATIGWLGYRLIEQNRMPVNDIPSALISSQQLSPAQEQAQADAVMGLTLPDLDGRPQAIAQWRDKILVVNYWASWCAPCVEEIPAFSRLQRQYAAQGVQFVGIGIDNVENMQAFVKATPISYPLLVADPAASQMPGLQIKGLPYTLVIGPDGRVQGSRLGRLDESRLNSILQRLAPR
ncbi:MAG TPA: TlpA disulfide reductase family protein [Accumulibacter sp.]|uniref:Cytochrome c biogenesis protein TlpA n=2 Tax=Candidatus Accumulibacter TaxID=327159 RepID=A0A080MBE9_9PROT|nr:MULTISPECIES: TlpA disulfide reductase family protein [Candidatus Accumulibacter]KFB77765.1 MAG: Cytochrome c biogenesis protein TlpA [Candidatus Accumulibacter cognatus]MBL8402698.1 TlpA family protein disulfide reductase [Accumulibacter sp.]MBN8518890.1 TlpA family protein disulfide reductase [Accumulibacter sp.]MBO3712791.1 TlpA family protein disulfide reductase [Accumulibacter sp.]MCC2869239.1 TlpA family protein disulfide reductase [Candidatus Accumulibacter phosphatis]